MDAGPDEGLVTPEEAAQGVALRNREWDLYHAAEEYVAMFNADMALHHAQEDPKIEPMKRAQREPFLKLAKGLVRHELEKRLNTLREALIALNEPNAKEQVPIVKQ